MLRAIRDGKKGPLVCPNCGCRLNVFNYDTDTAFAHHFAHPEESDKDAQGHKCKNYGNVWTVNPKEILHLVTR